MKKFDKIEYKVNIPFNLKKYKNLLNRVIGKWKYRRGVTWVKVLMIY